MADRLLFFAERYAPDIGGLAVSGARTARALERLGVDVDVLAWTKALPPGALETTRTDDGPTVHRLGLFASWDLSLQHTTNVVTWLHGERPYGAVWGHYLQPAGFAATMFAKANRLPVTVSARGNDVDQMMFPPGDFARLMWTLERADVVTAPSRDLAKKIDVLLGHDVGVVVVPNAVDTAVFGPGPRDDALAAELGIEPGELVLGFSGELRHKKGFPFLLSALAEVRAVRPACLLVVGEVRAREQPHLAAFAGEHPEAAARVLVTGHIDAPAEVCRHVRLFDVFLQPSVWEGLPNALLEAMACERLVITSDAGGIPEIVTHERDGFVLPRHQLHRLGEAILDVASLDRDRADAIRQRGRETIVERQSAAREAEALTVVLERLRGLQRSSA